VAVHVVLGTPPFSEVLQWQGSKNLYARLPTLLKGRGERMGREPMGNESIVEFAKKIVNRVNNDPEVWKREEEYHRKYGTLKEEDLRKTFTI
jgi:hypothetical protein